MRPSNVLALDLPMRHAPRLAMLALLGAACGDSATEPFPRPRPVTAAAPSGIPVAVTRAPWNYQANRLRDVSVAVAGDSLVFTYVSDTGCGNVYEAAAGLADGVLVVTDVGRAPVREAYCAAVATPGGVPVRLAVQAPTRGRLPVVLRERIESVPSGFGFHEYDRLERIVVIR